MNSKSEFYQSLTQQLRELIRGENDLIANLANICALIQSQLQHHWLGFYRAEGETLILGPFQGPVACTQIPFGKGVCGTAASTQKTICVPNVHTFPGHIACSSLSNSEIVVPLIANQKTQLVLDVDSLHFNQFDHEDQVFFEGVVTLIKNHHFAITNSL